MSAPNTTDSAPSRPDTWQLAIATALAIVILDLDTCVPGSALLRAQGVITFERTAAAPNKSLERGFSIPFDDRLADSLTKFDELVKTHTWDKAFRILADIPEDKWSSMLPNSSGFVRPASLHVRDSILELPADGREAYRIFFDAKARLLFDSARTAQKEEDIKIARSVYDRYFITSVGDDAADRLADDCFERGQFAEAAHYWKSILDFHADTNLPEAKLQVKRATALFRAGLHEEFAAVRQQLERDHPGARMTIGGREVSAADYLKALASEPKEAAAAAEPKSAEPSFTGLAPRADAEPAWRFKFLEESDWSAIQSSMRNYYGASNLSAIVPSTVTDGQRVYCNWLGACFALDVATGKTVWKSADPKSIVARLKANDGRFMYYSTNTAQLSIAIGRGVVLSVATSPNQNNWFRLVARQAATGKELWSSERAASGLGRWSFVGTPLIDGDTLLTVTYQAGTSNEMALRQIDLQTGKEIWSLPLGTPQMIADENWGQQFLPIPTMVRSGDHLYLLTDDGALLAIDTGRRRIEWAFKYDAPTNAGTGRRFIRNVGGTERHSHACGPIVIRDGIIYFKESSSPTLYAIDPSGPKLKWKWQDSDAANLVGIDEQNVYLFSDELSAISRMKPALQWSHLLPVEVQGVGPKVGAKAVLVFTSRGLFEISKETGDDRREVFRGADVGAAGGTILSAGNRLICVSNVAVTAYPEPSPP
jgi:outer membrane protein assembly factor BamB